MYDARRAEPSTPNVGESESKRIPRRYSRRGGDYQQVSPQAWVADFNLSRLSRIIQSYPKASRKSGPEHNLSGAERRLLTMLLLANGNGLRMTAARLCDQIGMNHGNGSRVLRRLGRAGLVVNRSPRKGALDLVVETRTTMWNLELLKALRKSNSARVTEEIRGAAPNCTQRPPEWDGVQFTRPLCASNLEGREEQRLSRDVSRRETSCESIPHDQNSARMLDQTDLAPTLASLASVPGPPPAFGRRLRSPHG